MRSGTTQSSANAYFTPITFTRMFSDTLGLQNTTKHSWRTTEQQNPPSPPPPPPAPQHEHKCQQKTPLNYKTAQMNYKTGQSHPSAGLGRSWKRVHCSSLYRTPLPISNLSSNPNSNHRFYKTCAHRPVVSHMTYVHTGYDNTRLIHALLVVLQVVSGEVGL